MLANESILSHNKANDDDGMDGSNSTTEQQEEDEEDGDQLDKDAIQPLGIRRWKLQEILMQAVQERGIAVEFGKRLQEIRQDEVDKSITLKFDDGTSVTTQLLLAADGARSTVRSLIWGTEHHRMEYTGVTCLMGCSHVPKEENGISLPSSETTKCHGAFYPTSETEQCFQFHFQVPLKDAALGSWGSWTQHVGQEECNELYNDLQKDGWDYKFLKPLLNVDKAIKIGFAKLDPPLTTFVNGRIALIGDAAHPPVPYLGQGAQQGLEDAGTIALLIKHLCMSDGLLDLTHIDSALHMYSQLRLPRTLEVMKASVDWGRMQQRRAECQRYNQIREEKIRREVFFHETMPCLFLGVKHDYRQAVDEALSNMPLLSVPEQQLQGDSCSTSPPTLPDNRIATAG